MKSAHHDVVLVPVVVAPRGGRGLKLGAGDHGHPEEPSPPSRGAWIEIFCLHLLFIEKPVAPLAGGVD